MLNKSIVVNKSFTRLKGKDIISDPKTPKGNRTITIPAFLYNEIDKYINSVYKIQSDERIFGFTKHHLNKEIKRCANAAEIKNIRIYDLCHSHASMLIEQGYNILIISERLGHENVETMLNTYGHLYPNKHRELADELENMRSEEN